MSKNVPEIEIRGFHVGYVSSKYSAANIEYSDGSRLVVRPCIKKGHIEGFDGFSLYDREPLDLSIKTDGNNLFSRDIDADISKLDPYVKLAFRCADQIEAKRDTVEPITDEERWFWIIVYHAQINWRFTRRRKFKHSPFPESVV